jgi:hypothetical protein
MATTGGYRVARSVPPPPGSLGGDASDQTANESRAVQLLMQIGSPVAIVTALMFYFGWIRADTEAERLGFDTSVTGMTTTDYLMKSILALFVPMLVPLLAALLLMALHRRFVASATAGSRLNAGLGRLAHVAVWSWPGWLILGVVLVLFAPPLAGMAVPAILTAAPACLLYGDALGRRTCRSGGLTRGVRVLVLVILALAVFWDTERVARLVGAEYAAEVTAHPTRLVAVTVFSEKDLGFDAGVAVTRLNEPSGAYRFRYDGFRLVQRSGNRLFLISESWDPAHRRVYVLTDDGRVRVEFSRDS